MGKKLITVITPVHNAEKTVFKTIDSVKAQTYSFWELIIIDDGSTDNSLPIIKKIAAREPRIHCIQMKSNLGVAAARNEGLKQAQGNYVAFLDADDLWMPDKLEKQLQFMEENEAALSYTAYNIIKNNGTPTGIQIPAPPSLDYKDLLKGNLIACCTVMVDLEQTGLLQMPLHPHEDYLTWLNILKQGYKACGLNEVLSSYRRSKGGLTSNKIKSAAWTWGILRKQEKLSLPITIWYFLHYAGRGIRKHFFQ